MACISENCPDLMDAAMDLQQSLCPSDSMFFSLMLPLYPFSNPPQLPQTLASRRLLPPKLMSRRLLPPKLVSRRLLLLKLARLPTTLPTPQAALPPLRRRQLRPMLATTLRLSLPALPLPSLAQPSASSKSWTFQGL